jgi:hypothetical protein
MANQIDKPVEGERYSPKYPRDYPASPSGLLPLPYHPNLTRALRSGTAALVLTYLEIYCPTPQDSSDSFLRGSVTVHLDQISEDLQISRRTLFTTLCILAARWRSEEARGRAARAGREFLNSAHTRYGKTKVYSITGAVGYIPHTIVHLRRNFPLISYTLKTAGITSLAHQECIGIDRFMEMDVSGVSASTAHAQQQKSQFQRSC